MSTFKGFILFAVGVATGAFGANYFLKAKYEQFAQEEIDSVKEYFGCRVAEYAKADTEVTEEIYETMKTGGLYNAVTRTPYDYTHPVETDDHPRDDGPIEDDCEPYDPHEELSRQANNLGDASDPYIISDNTFAETNDHYDKITLYYYDTDGVLANEQEEMVDDMVAVVGDLMERFGEGTSDPDCMYIRNTALCTDYEVIRLYQSYGETVGGFVQ